MTRASAKPQPAIWTVTTTTRHAAGVVVAAAAAVAVAMPRHTTRQTTIGTPADDPNRRSPMTTMMICSDSVRSMTSMTTHRPTTSIHRGRNVPPAVAEGVVDAVAPGRASNPKWRINWSATSAMTTATIPLRHAA